MCSTEMSAEKILALVLSIICWSACRTLSRMRERGDRMSGAVATTLSGGKRETFVVDEGVRMRRKVHKTNVSSDLLHCLRSTSRRVAIMEPRRRQGMDVGVVS